MTITDYVMREEIELQVVANATEVHQKQKSRVLAIYGSGGVGKSYLTRYLAENTILDGITWMLPIDVDDPEYWLLANLEYDVAVCLNKRGGYFQEYLDLVSQLPRYERMRIGHETVLSHLRRASEIFHRCYEHYVYQEHHTVVITLDTVEAIRGTDMVLNLAHWIKELPHTLIILAGRPGRGDDYIDPIFREFEDEYRPLEYRIIELGGFTFKESVDYLDNRLGIALSDEEKKKIAFLTRGHPLWLALSVDYLTDGGLPQMVATKPISEIEALLPYPPIELTEELGDQLHKSFVRQLIVKYSNVDFKHETVKRLAVARQRVNQEIWQRLMADRYKDVAGDWNRAWQHLLLQPWIRTRANGHYVTVHDALAEELGRHVIPMQGEAWCRQQWTKMLEIHNDLIDAQKPEIEGQLRELDKTLSGLGPSDRIERGIIQQISNLFTRKRDLDELRVVRFYYQMLCNFEEAVREFSTLFDEATKKHDLRLRELLWLEMQRFLPGEQSYDPLEDVVRPLVARFRTWYTSKLDSQYEIGCRGIQYLIDNERALEADERLNTLLHQFEGNLEKQYKLFNLRGNARMKIPGRVQEAEVDFQQALKCAHSLESSGVWGQAHKEIGFYYRNIGRMSDAAQAYLEALRITPLREQEELASIHTNSAYVQALRGEYEEALSLAETALAVRRRLNLQRETGMTLSVKGEALRYMRNFALAWGAYQEAAGIFEAAGNWPWLGMVYQEQAICLFQAASAGVKVEKYKDVEEMRKRARELSLQALAICRDMSIRGYPSALNRAARILSDREPDQALMYLKEGIRSAEEIGDGWFFFANVVEFAEICYQAWLRTGDIAYRDQIQSLSSRAEQAQKDYRFLDLSGRWNLLQGYLATHDALEGDNKEYSELMLNDALEYYKRGFAQEVRSYFGSHNATAISFEFDRFGRLLAKLPLEVRESWYVELIKAWSDVGQDYIEDLKQSTKLVTQLSRIYSEYVGDPQQEVAS